MKTLDRLSMHWESDIPLAQQLRRQLLWLITTGALSPGERLPPVRDLAGRLGINLHTVRAAYRKLEDGGLVVTRQGRGTYVLPLDSRRLRAGSGWQVFGWRGWRRLRRLSGWNLLWPGGRR